MQRVFFRNLVFLIALNVLIKPLWILGIDRGVQNTLGSNAYGVYFVLLNLSFLTQILLDLGISNYNNRQIAQQQSLLQNFFSNILSIKLLLAMVYIMITLMAGWLLHYSGYRLYLLGFICLNQVLASLVVYVRTNISALHHFKTDSMLSVLDKVLMIVVCGMLLMIPFYREHFRIEWFIYSQTGCYLFTLIVAIIYVLKLSGRIQFQFSKTISFEIIRKAFPFALLISLMTVYSRMDAVLLEKLLPQTGEVQAGIYASAYRLLDALNQFGYLFAVLLLPIFSRMLFRKESVEELVRRSFALIYAGTWISCLSLSFFSKEIMPVLYQEATAYSAGILSIIIFCFMGSSAIYVFGTLLTANGNLYLLSAISFLAVIICATLDLYLIPIYEARGAAIASLITQLLIASLNLLLAWRIFKWKINIEYLFRITLFSVLSWLLFKLSGNLDMMWMPRLILCIMIGLGTAGLLKLIDVKYFNRIIGTPD